MLQMSNSKLNAYNRIFILTICCILLFQFYFASFTDSNPVKDELVDLSSTALIANLTQHIQTLKTENEILKSRLQSISQPVSQSTHPKQIPNINRTLNIVIVGCTDYCYTAKMLIISIMLFGAPIESNSNKCIIHLISDSDECTLKSKDVEMKYIISQLSNLWWLELNIIKHKDLIFTKDKLKMGGGRPSLNLTEHFIKMENLFHQCAAVRLFLPYFKQFEDISFIFYMDTDILCFKHIDEILSVWNYEEQKNIYMAMTTNSARMSTPEGWYVDRHYPHNDYYGRNGLNSGVMFYNLKKARQQKFVVKIIDIYHWRDSLYGYNFYYKHASNWKLGDQDLLNYYFAKHLNVYGLKVLSCDWNVRLHEHCYKYDDVSFIMHGRSQMFLRKDSKHNNTYQFIKEVYGIKNLNMDIEERDKLQTKLLEKFRKTYDQTSKFAPAPARR